MKITLSKSQWETIGKTAGWLNHSDKEVKTVKSTYFNGELNGDIFGQPNSLFSVNLVMAQQFIDDSDFSEKGYGEFWKENGPENIETFVVLEYIGDTSDPYRTTNEIETEDPELFNKILDFAKTNAQEEK